MKTLEKKCYDLEEISNSSSSSVRMKRTKKQTKRGFTTPRKSTKNPKLALPQQPVQRSSSQTYSGSSCASNSGPIGVQASVDVDDGSSSIKDGRERLKDALRELVSTKKLNLEDLRVLEAHICNSKLVAEVLLLLEPEKFLVVIRRELGNIRSGKWAHSSS